MFHTSIAGSLPKPGWLAETHKLWPQWKTQGGALRQAKVDATLLWIELQEDAGLDKLRLFPCTNCGLAPMDREVARRKLEALAQGAGLARRRYA